MPIPVGRVETSDKDLSQPYPCQHSACGCKSAAQCWKSCCCNTPAQRRAWAKRNAVTPPAYAVLTDPQSASSDTAECTLPGNGKPACCVTKKKLTGPLVKVVKDKPAVVSSQPIAGSLKPPAPRRLVLSWCALKCQGASSDLSLLPWSILEVGQPLRIFIAQQLRMTHCPSDAWPSRTIEPDTPPPRASLS